MNEWKEYKLGDFVEIQTGPFGSLLHASDYVASGTPSIMPTNIGNRLNIITDKLVYISDKDASRLEKYLVIENDIVYSRRGDVEKCALIKKDQTGWLCGTGCLRIRVISGELHPKFCAYYLSTPEIKSWILNSAVGTTMPNLNTEILFELPMLIPDLPTQTNIAQTLSSIDDKIDLLQSQNPIIEELTETLFRQWFIEEAKANERVTLDEFVNTINGYSYKSSELTSSENALVTLKSFNRNGSFRLDGFKEFTGPVKQHQTVKQGDLIVSHTDITQEAEVIGNPALVIEDPRYKQLVITMDMVKVVPKDDRLSIPFLYFLMRTPEFKFHCLGCSNGTTVLHMSKSAIPTFSFPKPDFEKVKIFTQYAGNLLEKTFKNHAQIRSLNNFRDTILPKLISGEATIKEQIYE